MITLGITDTYKQSLQYYVDWLKKSADVGEILALSYRQENSGDLEKCDGLVFSGGGDIHPNLYGRVDALSLVKDVDDARDRFESSVVRQALEACMPILGICRGMQLVNVALGGTLIPDVRSAGYANHTKEQGLQEEARHAVSLRANTQLQAIEGRSDGEVNTNHHQAVDRPGTELKPSAFSPDGLIEALEWEQPGGRPFLQLVQWHPERMADFGNPLSEGLLRHFIHKIRSSKGIAVHHKPQ
jgi:putative glutamine amidotransferase